MKCLRLVSKDGHYMKKSRVQRHIIFKNNIYVQTSIGEYMCRVRVYTGLIHLHRNDSKRIHIQVLTGVVCGCWQFFGF